MRRMKRKLYIAYGSNMDKSQMAVRCPMARLIGTSKVEGYRLLFKGSKTGAYATIEKAEGYMVPVLVWEITEEDERNLDRYEGFPKLYTKKNLTVPVNGKRKTAMVYIMDESRTPGEPCHWYYSVIENAYLKFGFDLSILERAFDETLQRSRVMFINREIIEQLREHYPAGTRVRLVRMDDVQAPPIGTLGTVIGVDDIGSIMVLWDNGSRLHVVFGEDRCEKI